MELNDKINLIQSVLDDKSAEDTEVIDISELSSETNVFIIATALNERHAKTISDELDQKLSDAGLTILGIEGYDTAKWILLDIGDIIIHIFVKEERKLYSIEKLWRDGKFSIKKDRNDANG